MSRWTQYEEDEYRLPVGMKRIAYDAETGCYTFRDRHGALYQGPPGEAYGTLKPILATQQLSRPIYDFENRVRRRSVDSLSSSRSSSDFLPSDRITSTSSPSATQKFGSNNPFRPTPAHKRESKPGIKRAADPSKPSKLSSFVRVITFRSNKLPKQEDDKDRLLIAYTNPETEWDLYENYSVGQARKKKAWFGPGKNHQRLA